MNSEELKIRFQEIQAEFNALSDRSPELAIEKARDPNTWKEFSRDNVEILRSSVLIDAGSQRFDKGAIEEGCQLLRGLIERLPNHFELYQNLGNGLVASAVERGQKTPDWHLRTFSIRREARKHFQYAASKSQDIETRARSFNNLGNALNTANRWVEAYDYYICALEQDPTNAVASTGAIKILKWAIERSIGDKEKLNPALSRLIELSRLNEHRIRELAGEQAHQGLQKILKIEIPKLNLKAKKLSKYEQFVKENRLNLSLTIEGENFSIRQWDSLGINSVTESVGTEHGTPPVFAMFNILKADFLLARRLIFDSEYKKHTETGSYSETWDYANYGVPESMLILSQRMCLDILDKIAVAITEYFQLNESKHSIKFESRWISEDPKTKTVKWNEALKPYIEKGNRAIVALAEIALDLKESGFLYQKKQLRNAGTHRFMILHDLDIRPSRRSEYMEHSLRSDFYNATIESLRLVRAALIHFVELIALNEGSRKKDGKIMRIDVPSHHSIKSGKRRRRNVKRRKE